MGRRRELGQSLRGTAQAVGTGDGVIGVIAVQPSINTARARIAQRTGAELSQPGDHLGEPRRIWGDAGVDGELARLSAAAPEAASGGHETKVDETAVACGVVCTADCGPEQSAEVRLCACVPGERDLDARVPDVAESTQGRENGPARVALRQQAPRNRTVRSRVSVRKAAVGL